MIEDFITIQEAAEQLGKSAQTIRRMIKRGDLNAKRIRTPQGFHYVIPRDTFEKMEVSGKVPEVKNSPLLTTSDDTVSMLHNTLVQNYEIPEHKAENQMLTNQNQIPTNQTAQQPHNEANNGAIDKNELAKLLERHHHETLLMIGVIEKLQSELETERRRPKSFLGYFFDWLNQ